MNQEEFKKLLTTIAISKDSEAKKYAEDVYENLRKQKPSDNFIQLICQEVQDTTDQQLNELANVLMLSDIKGGIDESAFYQLSNPDQLDGIMTQLLNVLANTQNEKLIQTLSTYFTQQIRKQDVFVPMLQFIQQGLDPSNSVAHKMCLKILHDIISRIMLNDYKLMNFDCITLLGPHINSQDGECVLLAIRVIYSILSWCDEDEAQILKLSIQMQNQLLHKSVEKISQALQSNVKAKLISDTLNDLIGVVQNPQIIIDNFDMLLEFMVFMIKDQQNEMIYKAVIMLFQSIISADVQIKKKRKDNIMQFIYEFIFPKCASSAQEIQNPSPIMNGVDTDSLQSVAIYCVSDICAIIGQSIIVPVIDKILKHVNDNVAIEYIDAAVNMIKGASEGIEIDTKEKQVVQWTNFVLKCLQSNQLILLRDGLSALDTMAEALSPRIQNMHAQVLSVLQQVHQTQSSPVITEQLPDVFIKYISELEYKHIQPYLEFLYSLAKFYLQQNSLVYSTYGISLITEIVQKSDYEDIAQIMNEMMEYISSQFQGIMAKIFDQNTAFTDEETRFINEIVQLISFTIAYSPKSYANSIDDIITQIFNIIKRALAQDLSQLFEASVDALNKICESNVDLVIKQFIENREIYFKVLNDQIQQLRVQNKVSPQLVHFYAEQMRTQEAVIDLLNEMIEKKPEAFVPIYDELKNIITEQNIEISDRILYFLAKMQQIININPQSPNAQAESENLKDYFIHILETQVKDVMADDEYYLGDDQQYYLTLNLAEYIKYFTYYCNATQDTRTIYQQTVNQLFEITKKLLDYNVTYMEANEAQLDKYFDEDEADGQIANIQTAQRDVLENVVSVFINPIEVLGTNSPEWLIQEATGLAKKLIQIQNEHKDKKTKNNYGACAIGIIGELAIHLSKELTFQIYKGFEEEMKALYSQMMKNDIFLRYLFFTLKRLVEHTESVEIASDSVWNHHIEKLLNNLLKDGSNNALGAYDNIISYLVISAYVIKADKKHWISVLKYVLSLDEDMEEIVFIIKFFVTHFNDQMFVPVQNQLFEVITILFFGQYFSDIKHDEKDIASQVNAFLSQYIANVQPIINKASQMHQKNFNIWMREQGAQ